MIFGRPTNLWLGFVTAAVGFVSVTAVVVFLLDPTAVTTVAGAATGVLGALITLAAGQPPTVAPGGQVNVHAPNVAPDATARLGLAPSGRVTVLDRRHTADQEDPGGLDADRADSVPSPGHDA